MEGADATRTHVTGALPRPLPKPLVFCSCLDAWGNIFLRLTLKELFTLYDPGPGAFLFFLVFEPKRLCLDRYMLFR